MVAIGSKGSKQGASAIQYVSLISRLTLLTLCFLMVVTIFDVDAPNTHGDLHEIHAAHKIKQARKNAIGYAVTVTDCGTDGDVVFHIAEGAAVLSHSIKLAHQQSEYDYELYAIYHPQAETCMHLLQSLNYTLVPRETPVKVEEIKGEFLRERIQNNGCCGEKELIKLEAFTLNQHKVVVLLDLDTLILKPLDNLFDFLIKGNPLRRDEVQWPDRQDLPNFRDVSLLYTIDYAMVSPSRKVKPTQGGFIVMRPDMKVYNDLRNVVLEGDFRERGGWGGISMKFWGAMTIQGLLPYFFTLLREEKHSIELNRWVYDNMCSPAREKADGKRNAGQCFTQEEKCEECGDRHVDQVSLVHFTVCQKPWLCMLPRQSKAICSAFHHEWFRVRSDMEKSWGRSGAGPGSKDPYREHFFGYCDGYGTKSYQMIAKPYGHSLSH